MNRPGSLDGLTSDVAKLVGVSDDLDAVARATSAVHDRFGNHVSAARSQAYYLDVAHPEANKGAVARYLSARYGSCRKPSPRSATRRTTC